MNLICLNGKIIPADEPVLPISNRSFRYGDALFETMKVVNGKILLEHLHFERLFSGLNLIKIHISGLFTQKKIVSEIIQLSRQNECEKLARVRLTVFRSGGELHELENSLQYLIECWPLDETINKLNKNARLPGGQGLVIDIFPDARKSCDKFSNLKSANYLPYAMAALYAKENKLDDCLVLNAYDRICDTSIANIFWIKNEKIFTPPLTEGCIAGVMRRYLIEKFPAQEKICEVTDFENADEVFLTNAIKGIRWVKQFRNRKYSNPVTAKIFDEISTEVKT